MNLLRMAWRNIWRNKLRSWAVMTAVFLGLYAGVFSGSIVEGMMDGRFENFIQKEVSHLQIHHPDFIAEHEIEHALTNRENYMRSVNDMAGVKAATTRTMVSAMIASANNTAGIRLIGIEPGYEHQTTEFADNIIVGDYISQHGDYVIVGKALAKKMNVDMDSRLVLTFQDKSNEIISIAVKIAGIFETYYNRYDESTVFMHQSTLNNYLGLEDGFHEMAILLEEEADIHQIQQQLKELVQVGEVRRWSEVSPELELWVEIGGIFSYIFLVVILIGLAFGLLNTMLMSVFERTREIGMLMAIGLNKKRVFGLILLETIIIAAIGTVLGLLFSYVTIALTAKSGIDLSSFSDVMMEIGFETMIYPKFNSLLFVILPILVFVTALISAIYPALKALRLNPAEAVRK
jgi:putative ABC transport system permease protein